MITVNKNLLQALPSESHGGHKKRSIRWGFVAASCAVLFTCLVCFPRAPTWRTSGEFEQRDTVLVPPNTLHILDRVHAAANVAEANLTCAQGLPGAEGLDPNSCLRTLDTWAERVRVETDRHFYRFRQAPADYHNSEGYFRMLMMAVVLYEDFGVRYNPARISAPGTAADLSFFADSRDLFLHGLLGAQPGRRLGTCSSMPLLYAAIGRRLGYPLKLATTKAHVFLRWEGGTERFNLEATGKGMNRYDDEHFKRWPYPVSEEEILTDGYLKSLSPAEEVALFLSLRAHCLRVAGRLPEAVEALEAAVKLAPASRPYRLLLAELRGAPGSQHVTALPPALPPDYHRMPLPQGGPVPDPNPRLQIR